MDLNATVKAKSDGKTTMDFIMKHSGNFYEHVERDLKGNITRCTISFNVPCSTSLSELYTPASPSALLLPSRAIETFDDMPPLVMDVPTIQQIPDIIKDEYPTITTMGLAQDVENSLTFGTSVLIVNVNTVFGRSLENTRGVTTSMTELLMNTPSNNINPPRGPTRIINGVQFTQTEINTVNVLNELAIKGVKIIYVTADNSPFAFAMTMFQLETFGIRKPFVWCIDGDNKGPCVKKKLGHMFGGFIFVLDNDTRNLVSFVGPNAFPAERVTLMHYTNC